MIVISPLSPYDNWNNVLHFSLIFLHVKISDMISRSLTRAAYKGFADTIRLLLFRDANQARQDKEGMLLIICFYFLHVTIFLLY